MDNMIEVVIPGRPVPAARMTRRGKWIKPNAQRYLAYKDMVRWTAWDVMRKKDLAPFDGPIGVEIHAWYAGGRPGDLDNIQKSIFDGLNGIVWYDDQQVVEVHAYRHKGTPQRTEIKVWQLEEGVVH